MSDNVPVLVTIKSAATFRDDAIRYAYYRAGLFACTLISVVSVAGLHYLLAYTAVGTATLGLVGGTAAVAAIAAFICAKRRVFPQVPRISFEELEMMRDGMGLPPDVYQRTCENVLIGSIEERRAIDKTDVLLKTLQQKSQEAFERH